MSDREPEISDRLEAELADHAYDEWFHSICTYPDCGCAVGFPPGYNPGPAECPRFEEEQQ